MTGLPVLAGGALHTVGADGGKDWRLPLALGTARAAEAGRPR